VQDRGQVAARHLVGEQHGEGLEVLLETTVDGHPERPSVLGDGLHLGSRARPRRRERRDRLGAEQRFLLPFSMGGRRDGGRRKRRRPGGGRRRDRGGGRTRLGQLADPFRRCGPRLRRRHQGVHLRLAAVRRPGEKVVEVLLGEDLPEKGQRREAEPAIAQGRLEPREPAQDAHGGDASPGRPLAEVKGSVAIVPQGAEAGFQVGPAAVVLVEVEEEVDLDVPLLACELAKAQGESFRVERGDVECVHGCTSRASSVPFVSESSGKGPGRRAVRSAGAGAGRPVHAAPVAARGGPRAYARDFRGPARAGAEECPKPVGVRPPDDRSRRRRRHAASA